MTVAIPVQAVHDPIALPRSDSGKLEMMIASVLGTSSAPNTPWRARNAISSSTEGAIAQASDMTPNPATPTEKIRLRSNRSSSEPPTSSSELSVSR